MYSFKLSNVNLRIFSPICQNSIRLLLFRRHQAHLAPSSGSFTPRAPRVV